MIFFRKKKQSEPFQKSDAAPAKKLPPPSAKSLQEVTHIRVLTAEGWRRLKEKKKPN